MTRSIATAALLLAGCGSSGPDSEPWASTTHAVIGGVDSPDTDDGVLVIRTDRTKDTSVCSATLVAPNLLLTARHCIVAEYPADDIRCAADGTLMEPSGGQLGAPIAPENVHVFAGKQPGSDLGLPGGEPAAVVAEILTTDWPSVCRDDIALLVLDRPLSLPIVPLDLQKVIAKGTLVSVVGYGLTQTSEEADRWSTTRKRRDRIAVKYVDTLPSTFALGRSVCKGDSGGPALDSESGAVVGVYSLGFPGETVADCSSENALNYFAKVNDYEDLLREAFSAAAQPFPGDQPSAGGAGGAGGETSPGTPEGGEPAVAGGAGGEPAAVPPKKNPPSSSDGCQLADGTASGHGLLMALLGLAALYRKRRQARP
jgi:MYXO-CTERM domain-containing protein